MNSRNLARLRAVQHGRKVEKYKQRQIAAYRAAGGSVTEIVRYFYRDANGRKVYV